MNIQPDLRMDKSEFLTCPGPRGALRTRSLKRGWAMVLSAAAVTIFGLILKLISAEPAGWFLVPLATAAGICHVVVHARAARAVEPPIRLAAISDVLLFAAILLQIDFGWTYNCGHTTYDGIAWNLGWSSEKARTLIRGVPPSRSIWPISSLSPRLGAGFDVSLRRPRRRPDVKRHRGG